MLKRTSFAAAIVMVMLASSCSGQDSTLSSDAAQDQVANTPSDGVGSPEGDDGDDAEPGTEIAADQEVEAEPEVTPGWTVAGYSDLAGGFESCGDIVLFESLSLVDGLEIVAINVATGAEVYRLAIDRGQIFKGQAGRGSAWCEGGLVYGHDEDRLGVAYDLETGGRLWAAAEKVENVRACGSYLCGTGGQDGGEWIF